MLLLTEGPEMAAEFVLMLVEMVKEFALILKERVEIESELLIMVDAIAEILLEF